MSTSLHINFYISFVISKRSHKYIDTLNIRTFFITSKPFNFHGKKESLKETWKRLVRSSFIQSGFLPWSALDEPNSQTMSHKRRKSRTFFIPQFPCAASQFVVTMCMCILTLARVQTLFSFWSRSEVYSLYRAYSRGTIFFHSCFVFVGNFLLLLAQNTSQFEIKSFFHILDKIFVRYDR